MISLYLMRHGQAGDAPRDDERRLTERGRDDVRSIARRLAAIETGPAVLLSSPLPRASAISTGVISWAKRRRFSLWDARISLSFILMPRLSNIARSSGMMKIS